MRFTPSDRLLNLLNGTTMAITNPPAPGAAASDDVHSVTTTDVASPAAAPSGHKHTPSTASTVPPDIESWNVAALKSLHLGPGASPISLDTDDDDVVGIKTTRHTPITRRPPTSKHKLNAQKRERLGKGLCGHRHIRRWKNDHLASVTFVEPPTERDWLVHPTHPVHGTVPYALAALYREREEPDRTQNNKRELVPRDLRLKAKRMPAVRSWVRALEEPVRELVVLPSMAQDAESGDEDLVIVDGEGGMTDMVREGEGKGAVVVDGAGSAFRRWLMHAIADYYGLESRSASVQGLDKVVYVWAREGGDRAGMGAAMPRPLWEVC